MRISIFSKKLFVLVCLLVIVSPIFAIEFGIYGYNEYALGNFKEYSKTALGGGLNFDVQFSSKFPLGIGLRAQGGYNFEENDSIDKYWNLAALGALHYRFFLPSGFMIKPTVEYGIWTHSLNTAKVDSGKHFQLDQVLQVALPFEWTNGSFVFSLAPLYTLIFEKTEPLHQIGFRLGFNYSTRDLNYDYQAASKIPDYPSEQSESSDVKLWKDSARKIVVSSKTKEKVHLEVRMTLDDYRNYDFQWMQYKGRKWKTIEGENEAHIDIKANRSGRYWYCLAIQKKGEEGNVVYSALTQVLVSRKIGKWYNDKKRDVQGVVCDVDAKNRPSKIVAAKESENPVQWRISKSLNPKTFSVDDGKENTKMITDSVSWKINYPAIEQCKILGDKWYLPAIDEWYGVILNQKAINKTLKKKDATLIDGRYWTSTQYRFDENQVWQWYDVGFYGVEQIDENTTRKVRPFLDVSKK
ncbi:MAG: hypothetical protein UH788_03010 [Treponemataceae bacterium]|nr:hypothetical protein [Treponemataceae bacterium]